MSTTPQEILLKTQLNSSPQALDEVYRPCPDWPAEIRPLKPVEPYPDEYPCPSWPALPPRLTSK